MKEHIVPRKTYFLVWIALMALMVLTAFLSTINLGDWSTVVALAIAAAKALLVLLFFMHLRYESYKITAVVLFAGIFWMSILFVLSLTDYLTRGVTGAPGH
ncbi:MAG TPA: cytochrome C oxidase subunit IV family protein [Terriglobales bacterium]|nr:cytochrome C oxidase subunit IV family protein [Terriglobales bacterium]